MKAPKKQPGTKTLDLNRDHMIAMLSDPAFYTAVPELTYLRDVGLETAGAYRADDEASCCGGSFAIMQGVVGAFYLKLHEWRDVSPDVLEKVRGYLNGKKGYIANPVVIRYRMNKRQGQIAKFSF